jgi:hypothetical protein
VSLFYEPNGDIARLRIWHVDEAQPHPVAVIKQAVVVICEALRFSFSVLVSGWGCAQTGMAFLWNDIITPAKQ